MTTHLQASRVLGDLRVRSWCSAWPRPAASRQTPREPGWPVSASDPTPWASPSAQGLDATRPINQIDGGTRIGIATWYPARAGAGRAQALTTLEYRLLGFANPSQQQQRDFEDDEVNAMLAWRHIGIVELTRDQARASLHTRGAGRARGACRRRTFSCRRCAGWPALSEHDGGEPGVARISRHRGISIRRPVQRDRHQWLWLVPRKQRARCRVGAQRDARAPQRRHAARERGWARRRRHDRHAASHA